MKNNTKSIYTAKEAPFIKRLGAYIVDLILFITLFVGVMLVVSYIVGYQRNYDLLEQKYIEHGVYILTNGEYGFCDTTTEACQTAWNNFNLDQDACYYYDQSILLTTLIITITSFITYLIYDFIIPMIFKNGQTIGMKCFKIGLIDNQGIKVKPIQVFIRFLFGRFLVSRMIPIYGLIFYVFSLYGGGYGLIVALFILVLDLIMTLFGKHKAGIANSISSTYAIDLEETYLFDTMEELVAKKCEEERNLNSKKNSLK